VWKVRGKAIADGDNHPQLSPGYFPASKVEMAGEFDRIWAVLPFRFRVDGESRAVLVEAGRKRGRKRVRGGLEDDGALQLGHERVRSHFVRLFNCARLAPRLSWDVTKKCFSDVSGMFWEIWRREELRGL
jgi:hypothetical protein